MDAAFDCVSKPSSNAMIVSVHIPKTAGTSFRSELTQVFGARLLLDYDEWPWITAATMTVHNERIRADMPTDVERIGERYDAIHGHFVARKYAGLFPCTALVTMVRDPYQHTVSTYEHAMRDTASPNFGSRAFKEARMTLVDFIEAFPTHQALYVDGLPLEDFAMIGVTERYEQSVALFETVFGMPMPGAMVRQNPNPAKLAAQYEIPPDVRRAVERYRAEDITLYRHAQERFAKLCAMYGV